MVVFLGESLIDLVSNSEKIYIPHFGIINMIVSMKVEDIFEYAKTIEDK